jgi:hypothetical protein
MWNGIGGKTFKSKREAPYQFKLREMRWSDLVGNGEQVSLHTGYK